MTPKTPIRVQRKRTKGFKLPNNTVSVTRPGSFGNPYVIGEVVDGQLVTRDNCLVLYSAYLYNNPSMIERAQKELKGKNLACFCRPQDKCHVDILLEVSNAKGETI